MKTVYKSHNVYAPISEGSRINLATGPSSPFFRKNHPIHEIDGLNVPKKLYKSVKKLQKLAPTANRKRFAEEGTACLLETTHSAELLEAARIWLKFCRTRKKYDWVISKIAPILCSRRKRLDWMINKIAPMARAKSDMSAPELLRALETLRESMKNKAFLPERFLQYVKCEKFESGSSSDAANFLTALNSGTLITAPAFIDGEEKTIYINGFFIISGSVLAYEPASKSVYSIKISQGSIEELQFIKTLGESGTDKFFHAELEKRASIL